MAPPNAQARFFYTALAAALLAYGVVVINAYTRLSEVHPGHPVRSAYHGQQPLETAPNTSTTSEAVAPVSYDDGPWEQRVHPFLTAALALIVLRLVYLGWQVRAKKDNRQLVVPVIILLLLFTLVLPDIARTSLRYQLSTTMVQLSGALTILALLWWLVMREQRFWKSVSETALTRELRPRTLAALVIVAVQIALGAWSNVSHAGLPCGDFPTCQGVWWPAIDIMGLFAGSSLAMPVSAGETSDMSAITLHMLHRIGALITLLYVGWLAMHVFFVGVEENLCRYGLLVSIVLVCQISLGIMAVVTHLPRATVLAHSAVSTLLLLSVVTLYHVVRPPRATRRRTAKQ